MRQELTISEKILLLSVHPEKGGYYMAQSGSLDLSLRGALILDLELAGAIRLDNKLVVPDKGIAPGEPAGYFLGKIRASSKIRQVRHWLNSFSVSRKLIRQEIIRSLIEKKELRLVEKHFLFFRWKVPFRQSGNSAYRIINDIKNTIMNPGDSREDLYLVTLIESAQLLPKIYKDRAGVKEAKRRLKLIKTGNQVPETVKQAIQAAAMVATSVAISAAVSASHGR